MVVHDADPATKKKYLKKLPKSSSVSEEQPTEPPGKEDSGEPAPDLTQQSVHEEFVVIADGTLDEGISSHPLYSLFFDVVEELND